MFSRKCLTLLSEWVHSGKFLLEKFHLCGLLRLFVGLHHGTRKVVVLIVHHRGLRLVGHLHLLHVLPFHLNLLIPNFFLQLLLSNLISWLLVLVLPIFFRRLSSRLLTQIPILGPSLLDGYRARVRLIISQVFLRLLGPLRLLAHRLLGGLGLIAIFRYQLLILDQVLEDFGADLWSLEHILFIRLLVVLRELAW